MIDDSVAAALKDDQILQGRARLFVARLFDEAEFLIDNANPREKAALLKMWLPSLMRELAKGTVEDDIAKLRDQMTEMYRELRGESDG